MDFEEIDLQWFAAEDEGRTEQPSDTKLKKARDEGRVPKSQELNSALVMIVTVVVLFVAAPFILKWCEEVLIFYFSRITESDIFQSNFFVHFLLNIAKMVLPVALAGIVAAVLSNLIQNRGFMFTTKTIQPKISNIVPKIGQYLKKTIFSMEGGFNVLKSLLKVVAIAVVAIIIIRSNLSQLEYAINIPYLLPVIQKISGCAFQILIICALIFFVISIPDYFVQRHQFMESMKMTKEEVKQEFKEQEGDPEVKNKLQQAQRQLLQTNLPKAVRESDVVITNPTHYSVALKYDSTKEDRPVVNAKGADLMAKRIRELADEYNVPRIENVPLARGLYAQTEVGDIIPDDYIKAIAAVYTQIDFLNKKKK